MFYIFARAVVRFVLKFLYRIRISGLEYEPVDGPVVLCGNHRSLLDPPLVACCVKRKARFMAKAELFKIPLFSSLIHSLGAFPVNRGGMSMETMRTAIKVLKENQMLVIFPEGTRQKSGELGPGKKGAASLALRSGARIWPVAVIGDYRLFRPLKLVYGRPFDPAEFVAHLPASEQGDALTKKIMSEIGQLLEHHS